MWNNEPITEDITITVTRFKGCIVTFTGDYEGTQSIACNTTATLPTPPYGYTYTFTANGKVWSNEPITEDITITVTKLADCYVWEMLSPAGGTINHEAGTISDLRVANKCDSIKIDAKVNSQSTWDVYYTATSSLKYENRTIPLTEGRTKTAYIKVVGIDGTQKTYSVSIYRQTKSTSAEITLNGRYAMISAPENSTVIYTVDGTEPSEQNGTVYTDKFEIFAGNIVKAIVKEQDKDEYSDIVTYLVSKNYEVDITPIDEVYISNNKIFYNFVVESKEDISGAFIIGIYDEQGRLVKTCFADCFANEKQKLVSGSFDIGGGAYSYKVFLWDGVNSIKPITKAFGGMIEK